jgi:high-affinity nickel permease
MDKRLIKLLGKIFRLFRRQSRAFYMGFAFGVILYAASMIILLDCVARLIRQ